MMSLYSGTRSPAAPCCSYHSQRCRVNDISVPFSVGRNTSGYSTRRPARRSVRLQVAASSDYYEVLGVSRDADLKQIKQAFKRKALKLHPDVNKAPDAKEKFMECKRAYQALSDKRERSRYDQRRNGGGAPGGFSWDDVVSSGERSRKAAEEAFYGIGDFFKDLDKDIEERRKRRGRQTQPASLWEELSEIGEEFVEFLEKEIGLSAPKASASGSAASSSSDSTTGSAGRDGKVREDAARQAREAQERARRAAATAEASTQKINDEIEDMLAQMKRDLGIK